jgi:riboflavin kinase/FMN adenylyltransferase
MSNGRIIALGYFDGVHMGHGGLLRKARSMADEMGLVAAAVTFHPHPSALLCGTPVPLLTTDSDREYLMRSLYGMDEVLTLQFNKSLMTLPWEDFLTEVLLKRYNAAGLVCGHDFRFGYKGEGTAEKLQQFCAQKGMPCAVIEEIKLDGKTASSTLIRSLIAEGNMDEALRFYGHPHLLTGKVMHGQHLGHTWGIPTANVPFPDGIAVPAYGVYATRVTVEGTEYIGVTNVGVHPTVEETKTPWSETWILDFDGSLYGKELRIAFHHRIREERKFPRIADMIAEIKRNAEEAKAYFET